MIGEEQDGNLNKGAIGCGRVRIQKKKKRNNNSFSSGNVNCYCSSNNHENERALRNGSASQEHLIYNGSCRNVKNTIGVLSH